MRSLRCRRGQRSFVLPKLHLVLPLRWPEMAHPGQTEGMATASVETWGEVRRLRLQFADEIAALPPDRWDIPSWCAGWRVRDVLGHLVSMAESGPLSMFWQIIRNPLRPDRAVDRMAKAVGGQPVPELVERLRRAADGGVHMVGFPPELGLGDLVVHSADALRPAGIVPDPPLADVLTVLGTYEKWGRRVFHAVPHRRVSLVATDADWRKGSGPEVRGRAIDLLLLVANRRQVIDSLEGSGLAQLDL
jgi:uncharacterized protein (TIGR03083 family)